MVSIARSQSYNLSIQVGLNALLNLNIWSDIEDQITKKLFADTAEVSKLKTKIKIGV